MHQQQHDSPSELHRPFEAHAPEAASLAYFNVRSLSVGRRLELKQQPGRAMDVDVGGWGECGVRSLCASGSRRPSEEVSSIRGPQPLHGQRCRAQRCGGPTSSLLLSYESAWAHETDAL